MKDESIIPQARGSLAAGAEETEEGGSSRRRTGIETNSNNRARRVALMLSDVLELSAKQLVCTVRGQQLFLRQINSRFYERLYFYCVIYKLTFPFRFLLKCAIFETPP